MIYSIDPDTLPRCPVHGCRTNTVEQLSPDETTERCPECGETFHFIVEEDEDTPDDEDDETTD